MNGNERFITYLDRWDKMSDQAASSSDVAEYCLNNDGRTIFFMLEALCKIYKSLHNEKMFNKHGEKYKEVEDLLGDMDHYRECIDDYSERDNRDTEVLNYYQKKYREAGKQLNNLLIEKGWLNGKRTAKLRRKLEEADWMDPKEEAFSIRKYYLDEIEEFKALDATTGNITELEDHLHEFRRRLRWFSIYPHALQGIIQFTEDRTVPDELRKYQTPEIVSSPFNKFPDPGAHSYIMLLEKSRFLALSWLIDAFGELKDQGLLQENLIKALQATGSLQPVEKITRHERDILREANNLMRTFMGDRVLETMVREVKKR